MGITSYMKTEHREENLGTLLKGREMALPKGQKTLRPQDTRRTIRT